MTPSSILSSLPGPAERPAAVPAGTASGSADAFAALLAGLQSGADAGLDGGEAADAGSVLPPGRQAIAAGLPDRPVRANLPAAVVLPGDDAGVAGTGAAATGRPELPAMVPDAGSLPQDRGARALPGRLRAIAVPTPPEPMDTAAPGTADADPEAVRTVGRGRQRVPDPWFAMMVDLPGPSRAPLPLTGGPTIPMTPTAPTASASAAALAAPAAAPAPTAEAAAATAPDALPLADPASRATPGGPLPALPPLVEDAAAAQPQTPPLAATDAAAPRAASAPPAPPAPAGPAATAPNLAAPAAPAAPVTPAAPVLPTPAVSQAMPAGAPRMAARAEFRVAAALRASDDTGAAPAAAVADPAVVPLVSAPPASTGGEALAGFGPGASIAESAPRTESVAPLPRLDTGKADWLQGMIDEIVELRREGGLREAQIRLAPDMLGAVEIRVEEREDGSMRVTLAAETAQARALLSEAAPRLQELAEARGVRLGQTQVDGGAAGDRQPAARSQPDDRTQTPSTPRQADAETPARQRDRIA